MTAWRDFLRADGSLDAPALARALAGARAAGHTLPVPLSDELSLSLADAYRIQSEVASLRQQAGEHVVGWKLGYTSLAMRAQMGIDEPNYGPLTTTMLLPSGAAVPASALQPRAEPEIGLVIGRRITRPCSAQDALSACSVAVACLEIVDSVWAGYRFTLADNTADLSSAAWVVTGPELPLQDLVSVRVTLSVDGAEVASATGAAAGGDPAAGVAWLASQLAARGRALERGDLVITGGLTAAVPVNPGSVIAADFQSPGAPPCQVSVRGVRPASPRPWAR